LVKIIFLKYKEYFLKQKLPYIFTHGNENLVKFLLIIFRLGQIIFRLDQIIFRLDKSIFTW